MSEPVGEGMEIASQEVFDEEKRRKAYRNLKSLINRFLKDEMVDFSLTFDQHIKVTENEFRRIFKKHALYTEGVVEENGTQVLYEEYVFIADEKEIRPNEVILYLKRLEVKYHIEEDGDRKMYVIHSIVGTSDEDGGVIERDTDGSYHYFLNDSAYVVLAYDIAEKTGKMVTKGCITKEQGAAIGDDLYKSLVTISDGPESVAEVARRHLEELSKSIQDKYEACFGVSREG